MKKTVLILVFSCFLWGEMEIISQTENSTSWRIEQTQQESIVRIPADWVFSHSGIEQNAETVQIAGTTWNLISIRSDNAIDCNLVATSKIPIGQAMFSVMNSDGILPRNSFEIETHPGDILVIAPDDYVDLLNEKWVPWKEQMGYSVTISPISQIGSYLEYSDLKSHIQNIWDNDGETIDYIVLVGDVSNDDDGIPGYYYGADNDVSDLPYTLLDGDDFFPECFIGRLPVDSSSDLETMIDKIVYYEKEISVAGSSYLQNAMVVAGNYSDTPPYPVTPVQLSQWLAEFLDVHNFENIYELYWDEDFDFNASTQDIIEKINSGVGWVNYRGWADANGWHRPEFHVEDFANPGDLSNVYKLPIVTSIVCNSGDFANTVDPCFGEKIVLLKSGSLPTGAVAFLGASNLHTNTKHNNAIASGLYWSVFEDDVVHFGAATLAAKYNLYNHFPLALEDDGRVEFYFHVYNILGDPTLLLRRGVPTEFSVDAPTEIINGQTELSVLVSGNAMESAHVSAIADGFSVSDLTDENGFVQLSLDENFDIDEKITLTVWKADFIPYQTEISVSSESFGVPNAIEILDENGRLNPGDVANISIEFLAGETATSYEITVESYWAEFAGETVEIGAGETVVELSESIYVDSDAPNGSEVLFHFAQIGGDFEFTKRIFISDFAFEVSAISGSLLPNGSANLSFELNSGSDEPIENATIEFTNITSGIDLRYLGGAITIDEMTTIEVSVSASNSNFGGQRCAGSLNLVMPEKTISADFEFELGGISANSPTACDEYGYFVFDSGDTSWDQAPSYNWREISGTIYEMGDDVSMVLPMPFPLKFYGVEYDSITVCSNGWISAGGTHWANFRNWRIPGYLNPDNLIAVCWDDIDYNDLMPSENQFIQVSVEHLEGAGEFVISWNAINHYGFSAGFAGFEEIFQVVIFDNEMHQTPTNDNEILFQYHTFNNVDENNNFVTIGIEAPHHESGINLTYAGEWLGSATAVSDGSAILFSTNTPTGFVSGNESMLQIPQSFGITKIFPNPFNPTTTISFSLNQWSDIEIFVFDITGKMVFSDKLGSTNPGDYQYHFAGKNASGTPLTSGIYFIQISTDKQKSSQKIALVK